jgi:hypothetical protein
MQRMMTAALLLGLGVSTVACNEDNATSDLSWGHLQDQSLTPNAPHFLINKKPGDAYKVCVPQYMVDDLPGVKSEIEAAINVWGSYLGRSIPVDIHVRNLPRATAQDTPGSLQTTYYNLCGEDFDAVMGFAPLGGKTVGQTGTSWRGFSAQQITSFKRYLFLRDYKISPDAWGSNRWVSLQDLRKKSYRSEDILAQMQARNTTEVAPYGATISLPVLVHEFGHVWGLCDQYEGPSNCDPGHISPHPDLSSMMAAASSVAKIFLTDDDITGIRKLAQRPGFNSDWPGTTDDIQKAPMPVAKKEVEVFTLKKVEKVGTQYTIYFGLIASKGGELRYEYRPKGSFEAWQTSKTLFPADKSFHMPEYFFRHAAADDEDYEFRLRLRLLKDGFALGDPMYTTL